MKTIIYGASDDLIEIAGAWVDEHGCYNVAPEGLSIKCSDGTTAKIQYDGNWNITLKDKGPLFEKLVLGNPAEDPHTDPDCKAEQVSAYSDALIFRDALSWVKIGRTTFKSKF